MLSFLKTKSENVYKTNWCFEMKRNEFYILHVGTLMTCMIFKSVFFWTCANAMLSPTLFVTRTEQNLVNKILFDEFFIKYLHYQILNVFLYNKILKISPMKNETFSWIFLLWQQVLFGNPFGPFYDGLDSIA